MDANTSGASEFIDLDYEDNHRIGSFYRAVMPMITLVVFGVIIILGAVLNVTAIALLVRRRLWRLHEGYLYLLAVFVADCAIVSFTMFPHFIFLLPSHVQLEATSDFACRMWHFVLNVANCVGWIVVAMLVDAYLHDHLKRGIGYVCPRKFADKYCTGLGTLITVGIISICFGLMNIWTLWGTRVIRLEMPKNSGYLYICDISDKWFYVYYEWELPSIWIKLFIPVAVLIPVAWVLTLWSRRKYDPGFSVFALDRQDPTVEGRDFARVSLIVGAAVFLLQLPRIVTGIIDLNYYSLQFYVAHRFSHLLFDTHVAVVPLCCLIGIGPMRTDLKDLFRSRCCRPSVADSAEDRTGSESVGVLPLDSIQNGLDSSVGSVTID